MPQTPRILKDLRIDEISSVDVGAGRGVRVMLTKRHSDDDADPYWKRDFSQAERDEAASHGQALPDGSFPIKSVQDLKNAIQAVGRAKDPGKAKAHIKTRARALGASDLIPENWSKRAEQVALADAALAKAINDVMADAAVTDKQEVIGKCFADYQEFVAAISAEPENETMPTLAELSKQLDGMVAEAIAKMSKEHQAYADKLDGEEKKKFAAMSPEERDKCMTKSAKSKKVEGDHDAGSSHGKPEDEQVEDETDTKEAKKRFADIENVLKKERSEKEALLKRMAVLEEKDQLANFSKRAADIGLTGAGDGEMLLKVHRGDPEAIKKMEDRIKALAAQVASGDLFKTFGHNNPGASATAHDQLVAKAAEIRKADPKLTAEQAYTKAMDDPANRELVTMEKRERDARMNGARI